MNYTQQQIKRSNRKKTATIAFIGVMTVLLILSVFIATTPSYFANAFSQPSGYTDVGPFTVVKTDGVNEWNITYEHAYKVSKPSKYSPVTCSINVTESANQQAIPHGLYVYDDVLYAESEDWYKGYAVNFLSISELKGVREYITIFDKGGELFICSPFDISFTADLGNQVSLPETPTAPVGKEFAGWYYDAAFTQAYKDGDIITTDTSLYAKFVDKVYTVTYVLNGSNHSSAQIIHGNKTENLAITVGTGKEFSGWYTDAACTQAFSFDTAITADTTLYGKIETIMCAVTFYVGTEVYATLNVPYGSTFQAYAASAAADAATAQAILNVYNLGNFDTAAAIEEDTEVKATLNEGLLRWNNFGVWFMNNWKWLIACVGLLIVVIVGSVITFKKRR